MPVVRLHVALIRENADKARLRYWRDNPNQSQERQLPLAEVQSVISQNELAYESSSQAELATLGQKLYRWLDGAIGWDRPISDAESAQAASRICQRLTVGHDLTQMFRPAANWAKRGGFGLRKNFPYLNA